MHITLSAKGTDAKHVGDLEEMQKQRCWKFSEKIAQRNKNNMTSRNINNCGSDWGGVQFVLVLLFSLSEDLNPAVG